MPDTEDPLPPSHGGPSDSPPAADPGGGAPTTEPTTQFPPGQPPLTASSPFPPPSSPSAPAYPATAAYPNVAYPGSPATPGYAGGPAYPGATVYPQPKKRRIGLIIGIVAAVLVVLCGGAAVAVVAIARNSPNKSTTTNASSNPNPVGVSSPTGAASPSPSADDGPLHAGSLVKYLIPAPSGSKKVPKPLGSHNVFTAKQNAAEFQSKTYRLSTLNLHDFRTGAVRQWLNSTSDVEVELYGFPATTNARGFFDDDTADSNYFEKPATEVSAGTTPGGKVFYTKTKDKDKFTYGLGVARCGDVVIEIWMDQYGTISPTVVKSLLSKQYHKLCP